MTPLITKARFEELLDTDPKFVEYVSKYWPLRSLGASCPALDSLKLLQITHFDNGEPAKKMAGRSKSRFGLTFEGWTDLAGMHFQYPAWKINVPLPSEAFRRLIGRQYENESISQDYYEALKDRLASYGADDVYFGQFYHNGGGQSYFEHQYCMAVIADDAPSLVVVFNGPLKTDLLSPGADAAWSDRYPKGDRLAGAAKRQLRWDITGEFSAQFPDWATVKPEQ